jgi:hypothetical protein
MRRLVVTLMVLWIGSVAYAQIPAPAPLPAPIPLPPVSFLGSSTSAIDHNGNVLVFDIQYSYATTTPTPTPGQPVVQTRVTVIAADGTVKPPVQYTGAFQVIGAGWHAVYAAVNSYTAGPTNVALTRRLVAFNVVAGVPLSPLPAVDTPPRAEIKLSAARDNTMPDIISFVDASPDPRILAPTTGTPTAPIARRFAQIVKYAGGTDFAVGTQIPLP